MIKEVNPSATTKDHSRRIEMFPTFFSGRNFSAGQPSRLQPELDQRSTTATQSRINQSSRGASDSRRENVEQASTANMKSASMTSVSFRALTSTFPNLAAMTPVSGAHGLPLHSPIIQYPTAFYPVMPSTASNELKQLTLAQYQNATQHSPFPADLSKFKSPFINRNYLELAMLVCNTFRGKLFPCPHCRYVTDRRNNLKRHISTMHQACDKVLECCGVTFTTKASLREHIMIFHHNGYSCPYCGRRFCRKALLKRHLSVHSGQKDFSCPHCDYATSHKSNLERHKRIHERLKSLEENGNTFLDVERLHDTFPLPDTTNFTRNTPLDLIKTDIRENLTNKNENEEISEDEEINVTSTDTDDIEIQV